MRAHVVRRYLAKTAEFSFLSDDRFRPPASIAKAVDKGTLPLEVLNVWKYVVERQTEMGKFSYNTAVDYWRNKCNKMMEAGHFSMPDGGNTLPQEWVTALGGKGAQGDFKVKTGEQVEDWTKEAIKSKQLLDSVGRSAMDWLLWCTHYEKDLKECQDRIDLHLRVLTNRKEDNGRNLGEKGIARRKEWLEKAHSDFDSKQKEIDRCKGAIEALQAQLARYNEHKSPTIEFEKEFQFMLLLAAKDFDKKTILDAVGKAIERFEQGLEIPMASPIDDPSRYQGYKQAGILDFLGDALSKAWDFLKSAWGKLMGWVDDLVGDTKKIENLLTRAGAPA